VRFFTSAIGHEESWDVKSARGVVNNGQAKVGSSRSPGSPSFSRPSRQEGLIQTCPHQPLALGGESYFSSSVISPTDTCARSSYLPSP
jgi:hypothetical protein